MLQQPWFCSLLATTRARPPTGLARRTQDLAEVGFFVSSSAILFALRSTSDAFLHPTHPAATASLRPRPRALLAAVLLAMSSTCSSMVTNFIGFQSRSVTGASLAAILLQYKMKSEIVLSDFVALHRLQQTTTLPLCIVFSLTFLSRLGDL